MQASGPTRIWAITYAVGGIVLMTAVTGVLWWRLGNMGLLFAAIILGGAGGGFTLALIGGEAYGLKLPSRAGIDAEKIDPGFLGDVFVGLMAGFLGIGFGIWANFLKGFFDVSRPSFPELWFSDFAISYACGFLGLRLIKTVSASVLRHAELEEKLEKVEVNEADMTYLKAAELSRDGQNEAAAELFRKAETLEGKGSIRSLIGLARTYRRLGRLGDAIATIDRAITESPKEMQKYRIPVAYWNRACYTALASKDLQKDVDRILADLKESITRQPSFRHDLMSEEDLQGLRSDAKFISLASG